MTKERKIEILAEIDGSKESIDCRYTRQITCPHCGYEDRDSWETDFGDDAEGNTVVTCGACEENFEVFRNIEVTYTSYKIVSNE